MIRILLFLPILFLCNVVQAQNYLRFSGQYDEEVSDTSKADFTHFELIEGKGNVVLIHRFMKVSTKISERTILLDSLGNEIGSSEKEFFATRKTKSTERVDELRKEKTTKKFYENGMLKSEVFLRNGEVVSEKYYDSEGREIPKPQMTPPSPMDGVKGWSKYLASTLKYPQQARSLRAEVKVILGFTLDEEGGMHDLKVKNRGENHESLEKEALRVAAAYPYRWTPAKENGIPVEMKVVLPIGFKLD